MKTQKIKDIIFLGKTQKINGVILLADANPSNPNHFLTEQGQQASAQLLKDYPQGVERNRLVFGEWVDKNGKQTPDVLYVNEKPNADFGRLVGNN